MTGKNPEYEIKRFEEISRTKDFLKRTGGEDVSSPGEKSVSSHRSEKPVRSPDTINAYRAREPRAESHDSVDTINAYRSREPRSDSPYWADTEDEELDNGSFSARIRRGV
jgi:hypothetical protein